MARRSSGWTVAKKVVREIDRANKRSHRAAVADQKAQIRAQERADREEQKLRNTLTRHQEKFNKTLQAANDASSIPMKEKKLSEAREVLRMIKRIESENYGVNLGNLSSVEKSIADVQRDLDDLVSKEEEKLSLEEQAVQNTNKANTLRDDIDTVLAFTLSIDDALPWEELKDNQPYMTPKPRKPAKPTLPSKPDELKASPCPDRSKYKIKVPIHLHLAPKKKKALINEAEQQFQADLDAWQVEAKKIEQKNIKSANDWIKKKEDKLREWEELHQKSCAEWEDKKREHEASQSQYNEGLEKLRGDYEDRKPEAVVEYCRLVLARSEYPFSFGKDYQIEYDLDARVLALDYQLPTIEVIPTLKEEKFIKTKSEIKRTEISEKQRKDIYEKLLYAMVIRTIHELFEADTINAVETIAMNGWVTSLNKATGHDEARCIMSVSVAKETFENINLSNVDAKECFKNLKGVGNSRLSELVPVAPVVSLSREGHRFVEGYEVVSTIAEGDNLAMMNWEDFEHLIRELFEKEFCSNGSEVRVTQASRDGGVDAVIYDPDPIRGGKIVIQAKRYTNTVGVSAVRDLYGTVQHEGAMKGILITTSSFGGDAYEFAKGKPLALMNGENLIYLIERHGKKARIDLVEAKKMMA